MPGRELDTCNAKCIGHQVHKRVVGFWQVMVHRIHDLLRCVGTGHGKHARVHLAHQVAAIVGITLAQAASHDNLAVLGQGFTNGVEAFAHGIVDKTAGVHNDQIGTLKGF